MILTAGVALFAAAPLLAGAVTAYGNLQETIAVGKSLNVGLNQLDNGYWTVSGNSNPAVADASISTNSVAVPGKSISSVIITGKAAGTTEISVCDSADNGCLYINVTVNGNVLGASTGAHAPGTWVISGKTIYYVTASGLIPVPSMKVFTSNGGKLSKVVKMNEYESTMPILPIMTLKDSRVTK